MLGLNQPLLNPSPRLCGIMMKQPVLVFLLFISSLLVNNLGHAQAPLDYLFKMSLEELLKVKVVGATLTPQSLKTVPSAVTIFTHDEIARMGLDSVDELMQLVPGFQSYRTSEAAATYTYSARSRQIGSTSSEILILLDGQRLIEPNNSGSVFITPKIPVALIERVEFIRGPGAAIYGSNAMLGVINIITRRSVQELEVSYGSLNRRRAYIQASHQHGQINTDIFGYLEADNGEQYRVLDTYGPGFIDTDDPREFSHMNVKVQWQKTKFSFLHYQFKSENFYHFDGIANDFNLHKGQLNAFSVNQEFDWQQVNSKFRLGYHETREKVNAQLSAPGDFAAVSTPASNDPLRVSPDYGTSRETRLLWHNHWEISHIASLQFGLELARIDVPNLTTANNFDLEDLADGVIPIRYYGDLSTRSSFQQASTRDIVGLYSQYQYELIGLAHLTLGLRYDEFSSIGSQLSPRLGVVYEFNRHHSFKLLYGQAFRAPTESELNLKNNPLVLGNTNLLPETVQTSEVIWVGQWQQAGMSLGYFESHFKDSILQAEQADGSYLYQNSDHSPIKGVEFEYSKEWNRHWLLRTSYTHITEKPNLSIRESRRLASLMVNYQQRKWSVNLISSWQGERQMPIGDDRNNLITLPDYWQLSGKFNYTFSQKLLGFIQIKNALNEKFLTPTFSAAMNEGVKNRGREILTGLRWQY